MMDELPNCMSGLSLNLSKQELCGRNGSSQPKSADESVLHFEQSKNLHLKNCESCLQATKPIQVSLSRCMFYLLLNIMCIKEAFE